MRLQNRVAVVTGAASGLGRAIARRFAAEGALVVVSDVRSKPIWDGASTKPTTEEIVDAGGTAVYQQCDVSRPDQVEALMQRATDEFGRIDILVNNAGLVQSSTILGTSEQDWDRVMDVNLRGQFLCCKAALARMVEQEPLGETRGRIINVASQHGMIGPPEFFAYAVSKGGMVQMTRQLAVDYGRLGVLINGIAPGRIVTGTHPGEIDMSDPVLEYSRSRTPFHRLGRPEDIAGAALFLASDDCSYISGHNLLVDGGWMAY